VSVTTYHNFDLRITRSGDNRDTYVASIDSLGFSNTFKLPFGDEELDEGLLHGSREILVERRNGRGFSQEGAKAFGERLFNAIFDVNLARGLQASLSEHDNVRLRLFLQEAPELAKLPLEYLYDPFLGRPLGLFRYTPIVRFLGAPQPIRPLLVEPPLRVLVVVANPSRAGYADLDVEREISNVEEAVNELELEGRVMVDYLRRATLDGFTARLVGDKYHVLHFIGHGDFEEGRGGSLLFEDRQVDEQTLRSHLEDKRSLRIAVLNTCHGARASADNPFAGVAQTLIRAGVPAVIAMQFAISDDAAKDFARGFYRALAGDVSIDAALADARRSIRDGQAGRQAQAVEWGTPVLFLRPSEGDSQLLSIQPPSEGGRKRVAEEFISEAEKAIAEENWRQATKRLEAASRLDPINARVVAARSRLNQAMEASRLYAEGVRLLGEGRKEEARFHFFRAKQLVPNYKEVNDHIARLTDQASPSPQVVGDSQELANHYKRVIEHIIDGDLVFFFGTDIPLFERSGDETWQPHSREVPGYSDLAAYLGRRFRVPSPESRQITQIAQYVAVQEGEDRLYYALYDALDADYGPTPLHEFYVKIPELLRGKGYDPKPPVTISVNFDDVLVQTYKDHNIPFDLLKYAYPYAGDQRLKQGQFVHIPYDLDDGDGLREGAPTWIVDADEYKDKTLNTRPVLIKIYGMVQRASSHEKESLVITEDHHIDYLANRDFVASIPRSLLVRLRRSPFLFLGHNLNDWHIRGAFCQLSSRNSRAWLVQPGARSERDFWLRYRPNVEILDMPLREYVTALVGEIESYPPAGGGR
jgi:tetratricopeptide (TPR) repeat protein